MPDIVNNSRIAKNTFFLYIRMLFILGVSLFTSRILLKSLGVVDYGLNNVVAGVIVFFSFINASLGAATSRFITYELGKNDIKKVREVFKTAFFIHIVMGGIVLLLGETLGIWLVKNVLNIPQDRMFACQVVFQFVIFTAVLNILQVPLNAMIISHEKMKVYAYIGIADAIGKCVIAYLIVLTSFDKLITLSLLQAILVLLTFIFYVAYCKSKFGSVITVSFKCNSYYLKSMLGYSVWSLIGSSANMLKNQGVNVLMNIFFGSIVNAANAIAHQVNSAVMNFTNNFTMAMNPQIIKSYAAGEYSEMQRLVMRGGKFSFFLLLYLCIPVILEIEYLLNIWLGDYPAYTIIFIRLVLIITMIESFTYSIGAAVQATGKIKQYQLVISGINLLNFPVSFILYKIGFPPYTAFLVSIVISTITLFSRLYFIKKLLYMSPKTYITKVFIRCALVAALAFPIPFWVHGIMSIGFHRLLFVCVSILLVNSVVIMLLGLDNKERLFVVSKFKLAISRLRW